MQLGGKILTFKQPDQRGAISDQRKPASPDIVSEMLDDPQTVAASRSVGARFASDTDYLWLANEIARSMPR